MDNLRLDGKVFRIGRLVHFVNSDGKQLPMILTECFKDETPAAAHWASGVLFGNFGCQFVRNVPYDQSRGKATWHWPDYGDSQKKEKIAQITKPQAGKPLVDSAKIDKFQRLSPSLQKRQARG